jgi:glutathione S-transferase
MLRLYAREGAGRPPRVRWALEEVGEPYELVTLTREQTTEPAHLARHPLGRVPVLEDDEGMLFESAALVLQVADRHPESGLNAPLGTRERGLVYQWVLFAMSELGPALAPARRPDADPAAVMEALAPMAAALEAALRGREYLVGDHLTAADIVTVGMFNLPRLRALLPPEGPLLAYIERLMERPAYKRAYA